MDKDKWNAKNEVIKYYKRIMKNRMKYMKINFIKLKVTAMIDGMMNQIV